LPRPIVARLQPRDHPRPHLLFAAVLRGEHTLYGFRNRDVRTRLFGGLQRRPIAGAARRSPASSNASTSAAWSRISPLPPLAHHPARPHRLGRRHPPPRRPIPGSLLQGCRV